MNKELLYQNNKGIVLEDDNTISELSKSDDNISFEEVLSLENNVNYLTHNFNDIYNKVSSYKTDLLFTTLFILPTAGLSLIPASMAKTYDIPEFYYAAAILATAPVAFSIHAYYTNKKIKDSKPALERITIEREEKEARLFEIKEKSNYNKKAIRTLKEYKEKLLELKNPEHINFEETNNYGFSECNKGKIL